MSWQKKEAIIEVPKELRDAARGIQTGLSTLVQLLKVIRTALQTLSALSILELTAAQLIVKAAVEAVEKTLKALLQDTGVYVLFVPVYKKSPIPALVANTLEEIGLKQLPTVTYELGELAVNFDPDASTKRFLQGLSVTQGGNTGFARLVCESLQDGGDLNRPQFAPTDFVTGFYVVAGATDPADILPLLARLQALFGSLAPNHTFDSPGIPVPKDFRANVVAGHNGPRVLVEWAAHAPVVFLPQKDTYASVTQVAIIRSTSAKFLRARTPLEIFGSNSLTPGMKGKDAEVIAVLNTDPGALDLQRVNYRDDGPLSYGEPYYYAACFRTRLGTYGQHYLGRGTDIGFGPLSSVRKIVYANTAAVMSKSVAPDWIRTPSVLGLVPELSGFVNDGLLYVHQIAGTVSGYSEMLKTYVRWLDKEVQAYGELVDKVNASVTLLSSLLQRDTKAGIYFRGFKSQYSDSLALRGGNRFIVNDLLKSFSEANAPPFKGSELVAGMVVVAGAPTTAALAPVQAALDLLVGTGGAMGDVIRDAVAKIDVVLTQNEQQLGPDLRVWGASGLASSAGSAGFAEGAGYTAPQIGASDTGNCALVKKLDPATIEFAENMQPK